MASTNLPNPQSYEQILGDALSSYAAKQGINDFNVGSAVVSFMEVLALTTARASGDIFQILRDYSVDRATGQALQLLATENNVTPITALPATGQVVVTDTSFTKIATKVYAGLTPPNIGSITIAVSDASQFPAFGSLYIGRGTNNIEGPILFGNAGANPPVQVGNYWTITLNVGTKKFHNLNESVILSQGGNRSVPAGTIVVSPSAGGSPDVQYSVTTQAIILDGETTSGNITISASLPGSAGNVPIGSISQFSSAPFTGATVTNPLPLTNGQDNETDDSLRIRIKRQLASTGLGTATAVESSIIGITSTDEQATIVSDNLIQETYGAVLYIDDGSGYEAKTAGVGLESIVDSAIGGEQFFQLATGGSQAPVAKAFLETTNVSPFDVVGGDTLAVIVGGITYQHVFQTTDFRSPGSVTAYEITASINGDTALAFEATTSGGGTNVVIRAKNEGNDSIEITTPSTSGRDASIQLGFPSSEVDTLRLYKNKVPLSKDGNTATVFTQAQQLWSDTIANGDTLIMSVDGTQEITFTVADADFIATGLYTSVSPTNSLASWVQVFNNKLTGVTAQIVGQTLSLTSNLGASNRAAISIDPTSTLVSKGMFTAQLGLSSQGAASDYTLNRNTAQFELAVPLKAGDQLSAGTVDTEALIQSAAINAGSITFAADAYMWLLIDNPGAVIGTGVSAGSLLGVQTPSTNVIQYTSNVANAFANVLPGDYVIVWTQDLVSANRHEGRVQSVTPTTLNVLITPTEYAAVVPTSGLTFTQGFVVLRSTKAPQKFRIPFGSYTLNQIATILQSQTELVNFSVSQEKYLILKTATKDTSGGLLVVTVDAQAQLMNLPVASEDTSKPSLIAFYDSQEVDAQFPLFIHALFASGTAANTPKSFISSVVSSISLAGRDPNELISILHPYAINSILSTTGNTITGSNQLTALASTTGLSLGFIVNGAGIVPNTTVTAINGSTVTMSTTATATATGVGVTFNNPSRDAQCYGDFVQETSISGTTLGVSALASVRRIRATDRFYVASPLDFGSADTAILVVDNNPNSDSFEIPLYRRAITNSTLPVNSTNFNAYDVASGPTALFSSAFGNFDFSNFKALMQAKRVLKPTPSQTAILYRSVLWGRSGEFINIGYAYPTAPNTPISSVVTTGENVQILITLQSGASITSSIDASTEWNISVTPNTPSAGIDQVTYTYNGTGTAPALTLSGGEYVNITTQTEFNANNTGVFRVSTQSGFTPTSTAFSVQMPNGQAVAQSNQATLVAGAISFYASSATTALAVNTYVNANLSNYVTGILVNDGGTSGSGVIALSTYEDTGFTNATVQLADGINWISYANLNANTVVVEGNTTIGSNVITNVFPIGGIYPGASVSGTGVSGTVVSVSGATITISANATALNTNSSLTFVNTGSPQFVFKKPLSYPSDGPANVWYKFTNGEEVRIIPTTMEQVNRFISILAVSGFSTTGTSVLAGRGTKLELATDTLGSTGSIQIIGGLANQYSVPVLDSATRVDNSVMNVSTNVISSVGVHSDQWFYLSAANAQNKEALLSSNTSVNIIGNSPTTGETTVQLLNKDLTQRYFGKPRHHIRSQGRTFRIEKQGSLVCLSWDGVGTSPGFQKSALNFNDASGGTLNVFVLPGGSQSQYIILTGNANFSELSIGDLVTVAGMSSSANNGTFLVTGVSDDGTILQVLNSDAVNQFSSGTFTLNTNLTAGDAFTIGVNTLIAGTNFGIGASASATATNLSAVIGTLAGISSSVNGSVVTVTASSPSANIAISYSGVGSVTVSGATLVGSSFVAGNFSASSQVSEGDTLVMSAPANVLNQGQFRIIRRYNDSVWFENPNCVEEEQTFNYNPINLGFDTTTSFKVNATDHNIYLNWNGVGTEPHLENAQMGDVLTFGTDFASANQGSFMVLKSGVKLPQIAQITMPSGLQFPNTGPGAYFDISSAGNLNLYRIWFNVVTGGSNTAPAAGGRTLVQVNINSTASPDSAIGVANETSIALNTLTGLTSTASNGVVTVTTTDEIDNTSPPVNGTMENPFNVIVTQVGRRTFLECINPSAANQSAVFVTTSVLQCHRPQMQFFEYDATVPGDAFGVNNVAFGATNIGSYTIKQVVDTDTVILNAALASVANVSMNGIETSAFVLEQTPYSGYKRVMFVASQPGAPTRNLLTFDTNAQSDKINQSAAVEMTSINKLNFSTIIKNGLDSYKYNTGLIAEANKVIYGDPTDPITYPGVAAAGANVFIREPLALRITLSLDIRLNTGVPFAQTAQQVRNTVSALINANPVGVSIAISSIISAVQAIPGVVAVSISVPSYSITNDLIVLTPGQKAIIVDPTTDIGVSQIGS